MEIVTTHLTPSQAWTRLQDGNARFVSGTAGHPNQDASTRASLTSEQHPFAVIFGCSDSRLAAEIIFDMGLGDAFVVRTAGHVMDDTVLGTLEFAITELSVPLFVVLGHDSCGAVTATKGAVETGALPSGHQRMLTDLITPSVLEARRNGEHDVNSMVVEHVKQTTTRMLESSPVVAEAVANGRTAVVGLTYHLADGRAELVSGDAPAA